MSMESTISTKSLKAKLDREAHISGALNIPPERIKELAPLMPKKDAQIVAYCANTHGHASTYAARELAAIGYTNVAHYPESKQGWMEAGLPVDKAA
jgi:rhodanese-related sulfurtransferase